MTSEAENRLMAVPAGSEAAVVTGGQSPGSSALVRTDGDAPQNQEPARDRRLDQLSLQLHAMVGVHSFRVGDLLELRNGTVVETVHEHAQDIPLECGGTVLVWGEFEVVDQKLAVRITRLA